MHGDLKLSARHDLGDLGPAESEPVIQPWPWFYHMQPLTVWLFPLAAIVLLKENRTPKALLVALPLLAIHLPWTGLRLFITYVLHIQPDPGADAVITGLSLSMAVLLLIAARIGNTNRFATAFAAWLIMVGVVAAAFWSIAGSGAAAILPVCLAAVAVILLLTLTGACCRKRYSGAKFALWLGAWCIILCLGFALCFISFALSRGGMVGGYEMMAILFIAIIFGGGQSGIAIYLLLLPFFILAMNSAFFRPRFYGCFRLKGMLPPAASAAVETPNTSPL